MMRPPQALEARFDRLSEKQRDDVIGIMESGRTVIEKIVQNSANPEEVRVHAWEPVIAQAEQPYDTLQKEDPKPKAKPGKKAKKADVQGREVDFADVEPWPDPVDGALLLDELARTYKRFIVLPDYGDIALALWTEHTYLLDAAEAAPRLWLKSPVRECGKSKLLGLIAALAHRALAASGISPAVIFRTIEAEHPTLLLDEIDNAGLKENDDLRQVLNSGHTRPTARVLRAEGDRHEPRAFSTWCSIALAGIGNLPDTTASRSICLPMRRKLRSERVERIREGRIRDQLLPLRQRMLRWAEDYAEALGEADPELPDELGDREQDNWRPLCAIADLAGGEWPEKARRAAKALTTGVVEVPTVGVELLTDISEVWPESEESIHSADLVKRLLDLEGSRWGEWDGRKTLTQSALAYLLRDFVPTPKNVRIGTVVRKGYTRGAFEDPFRRYLVTADVAGFVTPNVAAQKEAFSAPVSHCYGCSASEGVQP